MVSFNTRYDEAVVDYMLHGDEASSRIEDIEAAGATYAKNLRNLVESYPDGRRFNPDFMLDALELTYDYLGFVDEYSCEALGVLLDEIKN